MPRQRRKRITRLRYLTATLGCCLCVSALSGTLAFAASNEYEADTRLAIVDKYVDATHVQQESLRGLQMEVDIDAQLPKLEKHGKLRALRKISRLGQITYKALGFSGDNTVKQEVITRYLAAESAARENGTIAITPANYKFRYAGRIVQHGVTMLVLEVTPKKKAVGLVQRRALDRRRDRHADPRVRPVREDSVGVLEEDCLRARLRDAGRRGVSAAHSKHCGHSHRGPRRTRDQFQQLQQAIAPTMTPLLPSVPNRAARPPSRSEPHASDVTARPKTIAPHHRARNARPAIK